MQARCAGMGRMGTGQEGGAEMMQCVKVGKLNLVDLAGSERVHITGATGKMSVMRCIFVGHLWDQAALLQQEVGSECDMPHVKAVADCRNGHSDGCRLDIGSMPWSFRLPTCTMQALHAHG